MSSAEALVARTTKAQGLDETVTDSSTLQRVATLLRSEHGFPGRPTPHAKQARKATSDRVSEGACSLADPEPPTAA